MDCWPANNTCSFLFGFQSIFACLFTNVLINTKLYGGRQYYWLGYHNTTCYCPLYTTTTSTDTVHSYRINIRENYNDSALSFISLSEYTGINIVGWKAVTGCVQNSHQEIAEKKNIIYTLGLSFFYRFDLSRADFQSWDLQRWKLMHTLQWDGSEGAS